MVNEKQQTPLAVITGGSGYVGGAIAAEFEREGWVVVDLSRSSKMYPCDVSNEGEVEDSIRKAVATYGRISACVHAAASKNDDEKAVMAVALAGALNLAKAGLPNMKEGSVFIGITTQMIEDGQYAPNVGAYIESKKALRSLLRELANKLKKKGIRVYAVAPGYLPGGLNKDVPKKVIGLLASKTSRTKQTVEHVAKLVVRIARDKDAFVSGVSVLVDGETSSAL